MARLARNNVFRHAASTTLLAFTLVVHYLLTRVTPQFDAVFAGFGAELPVYTQAFLSGSPVYFVLPVACTAAYVAHWIEVTVAMRMLIICAVGTVLMVPATTIAMYLPVFLLGAVVVE